MKGFLFVFFGIFVIVTCKNLKEKSRQVVRPQYLDKLLREEKYEEFNRLLGIDIPNLSRSGSRIGNNSHHPRFNPDLEHGDIVLTPWQKEQARQGTDFSASPDEKWTNGVVPYYIKTDDFDESDIDVIMKAIDEMNTKFKGHLQLIPYEGSVDDEYDEYDEYEDYDRDDNFFVYVFSGQGCYSHMGRTGGQQPLSLEKDGCVDHSTVEHEFMHAFGFMHEQCRPDRDEYITMHERNIKPDWRSQFEKSPYGGVSLVGPYDYYSAMHYQQSHPDFLVKGAKVAFSVKKSGIDTKRIGYAERLTDIDIDKVKKLYP